MALPQTQPMRKHSRRKLLIGLGVTATTIGLVGLGWKTLAPSLPSPRVSIQYSGGVKFIIAF